MGCYAEDSTLPILDKNMSPNGDTALTIPKCKNSCYLGSYKFAGVQQGNQCWCSTYVGGEWTKNQTDCNMPCTGDSKTFCGGKGVVDVFKAEENQVPAATTGGAKSSTITSKSSSTTAQNTAASKTAAAVRNAEPFWRI